MVDGVMLLVDASEGPLPQTRYVLMKALEAKLPAIVVDQQDRSLRRAHPGGAERDLRSLHRPRRDRGPARLPGDLHQRQARASPSTAPDGPGEDLRPLFDAILEQIPPPGRRPRGGPADPRREPRLQRLPRPPRPSAGSSPARVTLGDEVAIVKLDGRLQTTKITKLYSFEGLKRIEATSADRGDILALAGVEGISIGETITDRRDPRAAAPHPDRRADASSMLFTVNTSPFSGREGT